MNIFYSDDTLFVDLYGKVEVNSVKARIFKILNEYEIPNIIVNINEVYECIGSINKLKTDYSKMYNGSIKIIK